MRKKVHLSNRIIFICFFLIFVSFTGVFSAKVATKDLDSKLEVEEVSDSSSIIKKLKPKAGISLSPLVPMGNSGKILGTGFVSTRIFVDTLIPFPFFKKPNSLLKSFGVTARASLVLGFSHLSEQSDLDASVVPDQNQSAEASYNMIPFLLGFKLIYQNYFLKKIGLSPYFRLETGLSFLSLSLTNGALSEEDSSVAGTFSTALGTLYHNKALAHIDFLFDINYFLPFEKMNGQYLLFSLGAMYRIN